MSMISEEMKKLVTEQIKYEMESAYIYYDMATWLKIESFPNLSNWFYHQAQEEWEHAEKFINYLIEVGADVEYDTISPPTKSWDGIKTILEAALDHEKFITGKINDLYDLAMKNNERTAITLLQWFVDEQVEEESSAEELLIMYDRYKNDQLFDNHITREED